MAYIGTTPLDVRSFGTVKFEFTATAGQTAFTGSDDNGKTLGFAEGQIEVYVNGVLMDSDDFTTSGGNTVTLGSAAAADDIITVNTLKSNAPITDYVQTTGGTFSGDVTVEGALSLNRLNSDGDIALFRKDGSTVGSIGVDGDRLLLSNPVHGGSVVLVGEDTGGTETRLAMTNITGSEAFRPFNSYSDNKYDLGSSSRRFKDLYLSGGVYLGGTTSVNKLDDYEEGSISNNFLTASATAPTYTVSTNRSKYTKIGQLVRINLDMTINITAVGSGQIQINLPFSADDIYNYTSLFGARNNSAFSGLYDYQINSYMSGSKAFLMRVTGTGGSESTITSSNLQTGSVRMCWQFMYHTA